MNAWQRLAEAVPEKEKKPDTAKAGSPPTAKKNPIDKPWADKPAAPKGGPIQLNKVWSTQKPTAAQGALAAMDKQGPAAAPKKDAPADDPKPIKGAEVFQSPKGMYIAMNGRTFFLNPRSMRPLGQGDDMLGHHDRSMAGLGESAWVKLDRMVNEGR